MRQRGQRKIPKNVQNIISSCHISSNTAFEREYAFHPSGYSQQQGLQQQSSIANCYPQFNTSYIRSQRSLTIPLDTFSRHTNCRIFIAGEKIKPSKRGHGHHDSDDQSATNRTLPSCRIGHTNIPGSAKKRKVLSPPSQRVHAPSRHCSPASRGDHTRDFRL